MALAADDHHNSHHGTNESASLNPEFACPAPDTGSNVTVAVQVNNKQPLFDFLKMHFF